MNCVVCNEPMVVLEVDKVEIDHCLSCGGIWLDSGEMEILLEDPKEAQEAMARFAAKRESERSSRRCPICRKKMQTTRPDGDGKIEIDRCPRDHGLWFDRGELEKIIKIFDKDNNNRVVKLLEAMFKE